MLIVNKKSFTMKEIIAALNAALATASKLEKSLSQKTLEDSIKAAIANATKYSILTSSDKPANDYFVAKKVVEPYIQYKDGKKIIDGKAYAGDIPPQVIFDYYNRLMQQGGVKPIVFAEESLAVVEEEKKSPIVASASSTNDDIEGSDLVKVAKSVELLKGFDSIEAAKKNKSIKGDILDIVAIAYDVQTEGKKRPAILGEIYEAIKKEEGDATL